MTEMYGKIRKAAAALLGAGALVAALPLPAQQGHPLDGSWSGERETAGGDSRVLLVLELQPDQSFNGYILERGARIDLSDVSLDASDWTVSFRGAGKDREGNALGYQVEGRIQNLGSVNDRVIAGSWRDGDKSGQFRVEIN